MASKKVIIYPDKRLREKCVELPEQLSDFDSNDRNMSKVIELLKGMETVLEGTPSGLALAANQIGSNIRLIVFRQGNNNLSIDPWIANPRIVEQDALVHMTESCLSLPGYGQSKERYDKITVEYERLTEENGLARTRMQAMFSGLAAQVWQHEIDHLDGKLFIDDLPKKEREKIAMLMTKRKH